MDPKWKDTPWGHQVASIDELTRAVSRIGTLQGGRRYVWRGVADRRYSVRSSLLRFLLEDAPGEETPRETEVREREEQIIAQAREWGIGIELGGLATDLHLLALLQHHGVPTRLLDVTSNPMTALWFACQRASADRDSSGALFAFDVTDLSEYATVDPGASPTWAAIRNPLGAALPDALQRSATSQQPVLVRPSLPDARMTAQEGLFITGVTPDEPGIPGVDSFPITPGTPPGPRALPSLFAASERRPGRPRGLPFVALIVPSSLKKRMLRSLEGTYNRRQRVLFPDIAGFAQAVRSGELRP
jgi:FRG domain